MPPPHYVPPPLLTVKEIDIERNKANEEFIKISLLMSQDDLTWQMNLLIKKIKK